MKTGPIAVVSGGSSGIGFACAEALSRRGYSIVLLARRQSLLDEAAGMLRRVIGEGVGQFIATMALDVADTQACEQVIDEIEARHGPIDLLVNSAGIAEPGLFLDQDIETLKRQMEVNYTGSLALTHACARRMAPRRRGCIIFISSGAAFVGILGYSGYGASKFAIRGLAESLRIELGEHGISVSVAFPPDTDTPQYQAEQAMKPEATKIITRSGGLVTAERVAERIIRQALRGRFSITHGLPLLALRWVHSAYAPLFMRFQARIARRMKR